MDSCEVCGYEPETEEEVQNLAIFGCARALIQKGQITQSIELCSLDRSTGEFYAPGTRPETIIEDPDALKEGIIQMDEAKKKAREKAREKLKTKK